VGASTTNGSDASYSCIIIIRTWTNSKMEIASILTVNRGKRMQNKTEREKINDTKKTQKKLP